LEICSTAAMAPIGSMSDVREKALPLANYKQIPVSVRATHD
jgi:hypothetical protein